MTRTAVLLSVLALAGAGCADEDPSTGADECGARPDWCACDDAECQYGACDVSCVCDAETGQWASVSCHGPSPDAGQACPNAIASDENCGGCLKDHGAGASYCAASCADDDGCADMSSAWGDEPLVCHPDGYCTRACAEAWECDLGDGVEYACDDGRCSVCIDCF